METFSGYCQNFAIISDIHGATAGTLAVSQMVRSWNPEFIITAGDSYYPLSSNIDDQVGPYYHDFIYPYIGIYGVGDTVNRFFPALGNHDYDAGDINTFLGYFHLPGNERYYDFVKGKVHFFALNSYYNEPDGVVDTSVQANWLKNKLSTSTSEYNIVYFHQPAFTSGYHGNTSYMQWPFKQWGATVVISGHDHDYERLIIGELTYLVCGTGGGNLYSIYNPLPGSILNYHSNYGALKVNADTDSIRFNFINIAGVLIDKFSLSGNSVVGVKENSEIIQPVINIFPNPSSSSSLICFNTLKEESGTVKIIDITGNQKMVIASGVFDKGKHELLLETASLNNGIYLCEFCFDDFSIVKKLEIFR